MPEFTLPHQAAQLRHLAEEFTGVRAQVRDLRYTPGTDALHQIGALILQTQYLASQAVTQLAALTETPYTTVPGSRGDLEALASVVVSASAAGTNLGRALHANAYDAAHDRDVDHQAAHAELMQILRLAGGRLDRGAAECSRLADKIDLHLAIFAPAAPPRLTAEQYAALQALAAGAEMHLTHRGRDVRITTQGDTRVTVETIEALAELGLVHQDTSTMLHHGQQITITAEGHRALAHHTSRTGPAAPPPPPTPANGATNRRRK
ncbi:hypothetical protein ACIBK8_25620 [Streptomyces sp. NPDC050161]|uniref:hypothetical protein n=1 Tax=Streptomyces sp. NPDC050161 TaxID=3365604 RepID=UPI00378A4239